MARLGGVAMDITDLIEVTVLREINQALAEALGVTMLLTDIDGRRIVGPIYPQCPPVQVCWSNSSIDDCLARERDVAEAVAESGRPMSVLCASGCLSDAGVPVYLGERQVASWHLKCIPCGSAPDSQVNQRPQVLASSAVEQSMVALVSLLARLITDYSCSNLELLAQVRRNTMLLLDEALRESALQRLIDDVPVGLLEVDREGVVLSCNPLARSLLGLETTSIRGYNHEPYGGVACSIADIMASESYVGILRRVAEGQKVNDVHCRLRRSDGTLIDVTINASPRLSRDGRVERIIYALHESAMPGTICPTVGHISQQRKARSYHGGYSCLRNV